MRKHKRVFLVLLAMILSLFTFSGCGFGAGANAVDLSKTGGVRGLYEIRNAKQLSNQDIQDTMEQLKHRLELYELSAGVYRSENGDSILVEIADQSLNANVFEIIMEPGELYFISETDSQGNKNYKFENGSYQLLKAIPELLEDGSILLTGEDIADAETKTVKSDMSGATHTVGITMTEEGCRKFEAATKRAYDKGETIGIYFGGEFLSVPSVQAVITDGNVQISSLDSFDEAEFLASMLRIGRLKAELEFVKWEVVHATEQ